jgi:hypothetical protein
MRALRSSEPPFGSLLEEYRPRGIATFQGLSKLAQRPRPYTLRRANSRTTVVGCHSPPPKPSALIEF